MNLFFDTNILLDVALRRSPFFDRSQAVLMDAIEHHSCFLSWHTLSNIFYILTKLEGKEVALDFINHLCKFCRIAPVEHEDIDVAFKYNSGDFEDAMQIACALACSADLIVTRDPAGFSKSPLSISDLSVDRDK
ncbi:MAG: PIN domain-containing protein [Verrucomicrobiales bacterium]|nr:PIN domain-containing protein [Verrucomicrobiales bacterium]